MVGKKRTGAWMQGNRVQACRREGGRWPSTLVQGLACSPQWRSRAAGVIRWVTRKKHKGLPVVWKASGGRENQVGGGATLASAAPCLPHPLFL